MVVQFSQGLDLIRDKKVLICLSRMYNPFYYYYLLSIFRSSEAAGTNFVVLLPSRIGAFEKGKTKNIRLLRAEIARKIFVNFCKRNVLNVSFLSSESVQLRTSDMKRRISAQTSSGLLPDCYPEFLYLGKSLHSTFCDLSGSSMDSTLVNSKKEAMHQLIDDFEYSFQLISNLLKKNSFDFVIFFNGRNPDQAGIREASERNGTAWLSLENGSRPGTNFHLEDFQTQDRISFQTRVKGLKTKLSSEDVTEISAWSKSWLVKQRSSSTQNDFLRHGSNEVGVTPTSIHPIVPIYTSSLDETLSETQWSTINYEILVARTVEVSLKIAELSFTPIVIIHPNALKKSWEDLIYLVKQLENLEIGYVLPWEQTSPYSFLQTAPFVVSWRSTISVEASANGLASFLLADSIFDLIADVRILDSPIKLSSLSKWEVDSFGGLLYIYYFFNNGYEVSENVISLFREGDLKLIENWIPLGSKWISLKKRLTRVKHCFPTEKSTPIEDGELLRLLHKSSLVEEKLTKKLKRYTDMA